MTLLVLAIVLAGPVPRVLDVVERDGGGALDPRTVANCPEPLALVEPVKRVTDVGGRPALHLAWLVWPKRTYELTITIVPLDVRDDWFARVPRLGGVPAENPAEYVFTDFAGGSKLLHANVVAVRAGTEVHMSVPAAGLDGWLLEVSAVSPAPDTAKALTCRVTRRLRLASLRRPG
jgi:hypothetical protein